jgi:hypothetical protein
MRFEDFPFIHDPKNALLCCCVPVIPETEELTRRLRTYYAGRTVQFGYVGFSWDIDDIFHRRSAYFVITDGSGDLVMMGRGTHRRPDEGLPFEMAVLEDGSSYVLSSKQPVMDFNTFTYRSRADYETAMPLEIASWACYAKLENTQKAYGLYDLRNNWILRAYTDFYWEPSSEFPEPIHFPTYGRIENGLFAPTRWRVLEWTEETIARLDQDARERYVVKG